MFTIKKTDNVCSMLHTIYYKKMMQIIGYRRPGSHWKLEMLSSKARDSLYRGILEPIGEF